MPIGCWTSLSLNWCAEFMQLDFLSTRVCTSWIKGGVSPPPPQVEICTVLFVVVGLQRLTIYVTPQ